MLLGFLWLVSLLLTPLAWGSHTNNYLPYCYFVNVTTSTGCFQGEGDNTGRAIITRLFLQPGLNTTDGAGGLKYLIKLECCIIDSGTSPMPSGWSAVTTVAGNFGAWNVDIPCGLGYFLTGFYQGGSTPDKTTMVTSLGCIKPLGMDYYYQSSVNVPFRSVILAATTKVGGMIPTFIGCPNGSYIVGFHTASSSANNSIAGDLLDIDYLKCASPLDSPCPPLSLSSNVVAHGDTNCTHQYCKRLLACEAGYFPNIVPNASILWNPPLPRYKTSSYNDPTWGRDPRLASYYPIVRPAEPLNYTFGLQWTWQPAGDQGSLEIDLGVPRTVTGVVVLGGCGDPIWRRCSTSWVTSYDLHWTNSTSFFGPLSSTASNSSDAVTPRVFVLDPPVVAQKFRLSAFNRSSTHLFVRADLNVRPLPYIMIKEAKLFTCGLNLTVLPEVAAQCDGQKYYCNVSLNPLTYGVNSSCSKSVTLQIDWFYNGLPQPQRVFGNFSFTFQPLNATAITTSPLTCRPDLGVWTGLDMTCDDLNECQRPCLQGEVGGECHTCDLNVSTCNNTPGSYFCSCFPGYTAANNTVCVNVNECNATCGTNDDPFVNKCNNCTANTQCQDTQGSFTCPCKPGFTNATGVCTQVNECNVVCTADTVGYCNNCDLNAQCTDTNTSFTCACFAGFSGDGVNCTDINECNTTANCPANSVCFNTPGNYTCNCSQGFQPSGPLCVDVDECALGQCGAGPCENLVGSYRCPPYISNVQWQLFSTSSFVPGPVTLSSLSQVQADLVEITVSNLTSEFSMPSNSFYFGSPEFLLDFTTQPCNSTSGGANNSFVFVCAMSAGAGKNLLFTMSYCVVNGSCKNWNATMFTFSFAAPMLADSSLRFNATGTGASSLNTSMPFGVDVWLDGQNFFPSTGSSPQFTVTFGPTAHSCMLVQSSASTLQCNTGAFTGTNLAFKITVGRGSSAQTFQGMETISFVSVNNSNASCPYYPSIINVSGCSVNNNSQTSECPTDGGGLSLQITTTNPLEPPIFAFIGGRIVAITNVSVDNMTVTCLLPAGQGRNVGVTVGHGTPSVFSLMKFSVSYASPSIISISSASCTSTDNFTLVNCAIAGGAWLSIVGNNFGASGAQVSAGGVTYNATHDGSFPHQVLTIPFPSWKSGVLQVIVFANSGLSSRGGPVASYTFSLCSPGWYGNGNACAACATGRYTNSSGQSACVSCDAGSYQPNTGKSFCIACDGGTYSSFAASSNCTTCTAGTYAASMATTCSNCPPGQVSRNKAAACSPCPVGSSQPAGGMNSCVQCAIGTFSNSTGQASCAPCPPGTKGVGAGQTSCEACPAGRYQPVTGANDCLLCPVGMHSGVQAQHCLLCPPGTVSNSNGTVDCTPCDPGTFQDSGGAQDCFACDIGMYAANAGQVLCDYCQAGRATNLTQQTSCQACNPGEYQSEAGATVCFQCDVGQYSKGTESMVCQKCQAGQAQTMAGQSSCTPCDVGTFRGLSQVECVECGPGLYQTAMGQASCVVCPAGWYSDSSSNCSQCPPGTFSLGTATACTECDRGYYGLPLFGQTECFACDFGRASNGTAATSCTECLVGTFAIKLASVECAECPTGKFSANGSKVCTSCYTGTYPAGTACMSCPPGAIVNSKQQPFCRCPAGQYGLEFLNSQGLIEYSCLPNPAGTRSDTGITEAELVTLSGYWRSSNATLTYYRCYAPQFCLGGLNSDCAPFREGPVCALCKPGYKSAGSTRECVPCPALVESSWGITFAILIAVGIALIVTYWLILKMADVQQKEMLEKFKKSQDAAIAAMSATTAVGDEYFTQLRAEIQDKEVEEEEVEAKKQEEVITYGQRRAPNFMYKIKIVVSFYQIASLLPAQGGIHWPQQFVEFINFFSFLNFDFIPWQNLSCAVTINYYTKILIVGLLPIGLIVALGSFFSLSLIYYGRTDNLSDQMAKQNRVMRIKRQFTKCVLFTIFLLYPFVSRTSLGVYNCFTVEGVRYLAADFSLLCDAPDWNVAAGYTAVFVLLYPIGTPLIYFYLMYNADRRSPDAFLELGFLYEAYVDDRWYWELFDMGHKLILTSIVVFLPSEMIMGANMVIMVLYLILLLVCHPYLRKGDDRLHLLGQVNLFVLALMGHALRSLDNPFYSPLASDDTVEVLLATMLILINCIFLLSFLIIAGRNVKKAVVDYTKKRKIQLLLKEQPSSSARPSANQANLAG